MNDANLPSTPEDAKNLVREMRKAGLLTTETLMQLAEETEKTSDAVRAVVPEAVATEEAIKEEPLTPVPFAELKAFLAPKGINLQQQLDDHVSLMVRRGIVLADEADTYRAKFNTINVRKSELENIPEGYRPMLFVNNMTPVQAAETFITGQNINLHEYSTLADFKKIDSNTGKNLENQSPSGLARFSFTPDTANLTKDLTGKPADSKLDQMKEGKKFMEPAQWFQMFVEGLEKAIKELKLGNGKDWKDMTKKERQEIMQNKAIDSYLPDVQTWTQFPDYRNQYGDVLSLSWDPGSREVRVGRWLPGNALGYVGVRLFLG